MNNRDNIKVGDDFLSDILCVCEKIYNTVKQTMGPEGKYIILEQNYDNPKTVRDGVSVAKSIDLKDDLEKVIAKVFKQSIIKTNDDAGDGTTATTVLSYAILKIAYKMYMAGWSRYNIIESLKQVEKILIKELNNISKKVTNDEDLINVASVSANSLEIGKIIANAFKKVGPNGSITVDDANSIDTSLSFTEGITINSGFLSRAFVTNHNKNICELKNPYIILISSKNENTIKDYYNIIQILLEAKRDFLIISDDIRNELLQVFIRNKISPLGAFKDIRFSIIKPSGFGDAKFEELEDISYLVNAKILGNEHGLPLSKVNNNTFGSCDKITVYKDKTVIVGGHGSNESIIAHKNYLRNLLTDTKKNFEKKDIKNRFSRFGSGVAIINVGASTESEAIDKKERIEDSLNSTKSALESGIVIGGGIIYLKLINILQKKYYNKEDLKIGIDIISESFLYPIKCILTNSGQNVNHIVEQLKTMIQKDDNIGYDVISKKFVNMYKKGIIDPCKVVKCAIVNSMSIVYMLFNSNGISLIDKKKDENKDRSY